MTPSTTNTAAREVVAGLDIEIAALGNQSHDPSYTRLNLARSFILATLTQQQGGEQEAGDVYRQARELLAAEYERENYSLSADQVRDGALGSNEILAVRAITAALRTKQPAASEGDVGRVVEDALQHWEARAKTCDDEAERFSATEPRLSRELSRDAGQYRSCIGGLRASLANINTSKQAAGEAVDLNDEVLVKLNAHGLAILKADHDAFRAQVPSIAEWSPPKTDAEGFSRRQLWCLFQDFGPHISLPAKKPFDALRLPATPPRHPADEGRDALVELRSLAMVLRGGSWNMKTPVELADAIAQGCDDIAAALQAGTP